MQRTLDGWAGRHPLLVPGLLWLFILAVGLLCRPLLPVDETRAVTVAWEMWTRGEFLVPHLNGAPYSHKPPVLQWGMQLGWLLFGVNDWTPRLVAPLFGLASLGLTRAIAQRLWPEHPGATNLVPWILLGLPLWATWSTLTLYDVPIGAFILLALLGVLRAADGERSGWPLTALAVAGALLTKGPVVLIFLLPVALAAPWWSTAPARGWGGWHLGLIAALLGGIVLALCWAVPAALHGGEEYGRLILWGQFAGRVAHSFAHQRPLWWYAPVLPMMLMPWVLWPALWRAVCRLPLDRGVRFCLAIVVPALLLLTLISGKQVHYLLPLLPILALLAARALGGAPAATTTPSSLWGLGILFLGLAGSGIALRALVLFDAQPAIPTILRPWLLDTHPIWLAALLALGIHALRSRPASAASGVSRIALLSLALLVMGHLAFRHVQFERWDIRPLARIVAQKQAEGWPVAQRDKVHGDLGFLGRLTLPVAETLEDAALSDWIRTHPDGYVLLHFKAEDGLWPVGLAEYTQDYRSKKVGLWQARVLRDWLGYNRATPPP